MSLESRIRLWPGVTGVGLQWLFWLILPLVFADAAGASVIGGVVGGIVVLVWWMLFSRVPHVERWGAIALIALAIAVAPKFLDASIKGGMMGFMFPIYVIPCVSLALVGWAALSQSMGTGARRASLVGAIAAACAVWALLRTDGITGAGRAQLAWRWTKTSEQMLAGAAAVANPPKAAEGGVQWAGFRGARRDSVVAGVRIQTDWAAAPPTKLWRQAVGPGWSSFAAGAGLLYTQEQRGESEMVSCYDAATGKPVWSHSDVARFWESNGGAGPRGTPALHDGRIYSLGATGIVNALDALTGAVLWTRNAATDTGAKLPEWGFSGSPLVAGDVVIVAASGRLAAYELATGKPRWIQKTGGGSYSSPHPATIGGVEQILFWNAAGLNGFDPADGKQLWNHQWSGGSMLQPALVSNDLLISSSDMMGGIGLRRLAVASGSGSWTATEKWTSNGLKPYFNDFVVHKGHAYGFDGAILSCINLEDGKRQWKGGRYGHGQMLLLVEQDLLLVLSEEGELALVGAVPGQFTEIAKMPALEGKTWNHPAMAGHTLVVRNGQEMAAFRLAPAGS